MSPGKRRIWFPLVRLSVFVAAAVLSGHFILTRVHDPQENLFLSSPKRTFEQAKRKWVRQIRGAEMFLRPVMPATSVPLPPVERDDETAPSPVFTAVPLPPAKDPVPAPAIPEVAAFLAPAPVGDPLAHLEREIRLFPDPLRRPALEIEPYVSEWDRELLPPALSELYGPNRAVGWVRDVERVTDSLFLLPELAVDGVVGFIRSFRSPGSEQPFRVEREDGRSLTSRLLDIEQVRPRLAHPTATFLGRWLEEEGKYLSGYDMTDLRVPGYEYAAAEVDLDGLWHDQGEVLWDTVKSTYLSKYRLRGEKELRSDDLYFRQWRGEDFVVMPTLLAAYAFYRGFDKRIKFGDFRVGLHLESIRRIAETLDDGTQAALAGLSFSARFLPFQILVSAGVQEGDLEVDFVGIGTNFRQLRRLLGEDP